MKIFKCFWLFGHNWTKWEGAIAEYSSWDSKKIEREVQTRTCKDCGLRQMKDISPF